MFYQTQVLQVATALADALLNALSTRPAAALLDTPTAHLLKVNYQIGPTWDPTLLATDEADFVGYAAAALGAVIGPVQLPNGARAVHVEVDFAAGAIVAPGQTCYSYVVTNGAGTVFYFGETMAVPAYFAVNGDFLSLDVVVPEPLVRLAV